MSFARLTVSLILYVIVFLALISLSKCDDVKLFDFDVIPGGQKGEFESEKWHGITCKFTYACQGGTKEHWQLSLRRDDDFNYKCVVERPEGVSLSYLYFSEFQVDVTGAGVEDAEVHGADLDTPLDRKEFNLEKEKHIVKNSKDFKNSLNRIDVSLIRKKGVKEDL